MSKSAFNEINVAIRVIRQSKNIQEKRLQEAQKQIQELQQGMQTRLHENQKCEAKIEENLDWNSWAVKETNRLLAEIEEAQESLLGLKEDLKLIENKIE